MAAPFQGSSQTISSATQPDSQSVSSVQSHDRDAPAAVPSPDDHVTTTSESVDDAALRAEVSRLVSRVLAKAVSEVCMEEPLDIQVIPHLLISYRHYMVWAKGKC